MIVERFEASKPIELWGGLTIKDYPRMGNPDRARIAEVYIPDCKVGDVIQFNLGFEVTNNQYYAVELAGKIRFTKDAYPIISGQIVSEGRGYNVTPQTNPSGGVFHGMHHGVVDRSGSFEVAEDGDYYLIADFYAGGSSYTQPSESLTIESGYGNFDAIRFRG